MLMTRCTRNGEINTGESKNDDGLFFFLILRKERKESANRGLELRLRGINFKFHSKNSKSNGQKWQKFYRANFDLMKYKNFNKLKLRGRKIYFDK